jgi:hypothetical protein
MPALHFPAGLEGIGSGDGLEPSNSVRLLAIENLITMHGEQPLSGQKHQFLWSAAEKENQHDQHSPQEPIMLLKSNNP